MQPSSLKLRTQFNDRADMHAYLQKVFPEAAARDATLSPITGGRKAAEERLDKVDPIRYSSSRNFLDGAVTRLSPYIRHGVVTLAEVRRSVLKRTTAQKSEKLLNELAWRDYWQRLYAQLGNGIWKNQEAYKTGHTTYAATLPAEIPAGTTGLVCIDSIATDLHTTGYLHNHQRMWMAAYIVHHRRVQWQAGARWFLQHLLDGDPASNNLSWQWVASTFSVKPYIFNRENVERYTNGSYCRRCPLADNGCPFQASYADLEERLFIALPDRSTNSRNSPHRRGQRS